MTDPRGDVECREQRGRALALIVMGAPLINPAAYSFTSMAIMDALKMFPGPIIEVYISNVHRREEMYHHSYMSAVATAVIAGLGPGGYRAAIKAILQMLREETA